MQTQRYRYAVAALGIAGLIAVVYAMKPSSGELAIQNATLNNEITDHGTPENPRASDCLDESLRGVSCNDLLIASAAAGQAMP